MTKPSAIEQAIRLGVGDQVISLIGCDWGRQVGLPGDADPCMRQAKQRVIIHGAPVPMLQLCPEHFAVIEAETDPSEADDAR